MTAPIHEDDEPDEGFPWFWLVAALIVLMCALGVALVEPVEVDRPASVPTTYGPPCR